LANISRHSAVILADGYFGCELSAVSCGLKPADIRMIIVMTMNVGYLFSVLGGIFVGELVFGRLMSGGGGHVRAATGTQVTN